MKYFLRCLMIPALCLAFPAWSAPDLTGAGLAGLTLDMSLTETRAEHPDADWQEIRSAHSGKLLSIHSREPIQWAGQLWQVSFANAGYGDSRLQFSHEENLSKSACRELVMQVAAQAETELGILGTVSKTPAKKLVTRGGFRIEEFSTHIDHWHEIRWVGQRNLTSTRWAELLGRFEIEPGLTPCRISVTVVSDVPHEPQILDPSSLHRVAQASISERHRFLEFVTLPFALTRIGFSCRIAATTGTLSECSPRGTEAREDLVSAARQNLAKLRFDTSGLDPDSPTPLVARIEVELDPKDRRTLVEPVPFVPDHGARQVTIPRGDAISSSYPRRALARELEATVNVRCQIQGDGSSICSSANVVPDILEVPEDWEVLSREFERAGFQLAQRAMYQLKLKSGASSEGVWIEQKVRFQLDD